MSGETPNGDAGSTFTAPSQDTALREGALEGTLLKRSVKARRQGALGLRSGRRFEKTGRRH